MAVLDATGGLCSIQNMACTFNTRHSHIALVDNSALPGALAIGIKMSRLPACLTEHGVVKGPQMPLHTSPWDRSATACARARRPSPPQLQSRRLQTAPRHLRTAGHPPRALSSGFWGCTSAIGQSAPPAQTVACCTLGHRDSKIMRGAALLRLGQVSGWHGLAWAHACEGSSSIEAGIHA